MIFLLAVLSQPLLTKRCVAHAKAMSDNVSVQSLPGYSFFRHDGAPMRASLWSSRDRVNRRYTDGLHRVGGTNRQTTGEKSSSGIASLHCLKPGEWCRGGRCVLRQLLPGRSWNIHSDDVCVPLHSAQRDVPGASCATWLVNLQLDRRPPLPRSP
jgi:hypothetical protein